MPFTTVGLNNIAKLLIGESVNPMNAANGFLGVGDSTTAFAVGQTDLQAATNKAREALDGAPGRSGAVITYTATFEDADAQFAWNEMGGFNASSGGDMYWRKVLSPSLGTKAGGAWTLVVTQTLTLA